MTVRRKSRHGVNLGVQVSLRAADEAERERWRATAASYGMTLTGWLRALANGDGPSLIQLQRRSSRKAAASEKSTRGA